MMARAMPPYSRTPANRFEILDEEGLDARPLGSRQHIDSPRSAGGVLAELPIDHPGLQQDSTLRSQSRLLRSAPVQANADTVSPQAASRGSRRRPIIGSDTFEPLDSVEEETSWLDKLADSTRLHGIKLGLPAKRAPAQPENDENVHPLASAAANNDITTQIEKQLAGQFEWLISYPAPAGSADDHFGTPSHTSHDDCASRNLVFGCNLLRRKPGSATPSTQHSSSDADTFTFIATPIEGDTQGLQDCFDHGKMSQGNMALSLNPPILCTPAKTAITVEAVEQMLSPPLTVASDKTSLLDCYSPLGSAVSSPRIEDSLAEIDKLEDDLEAVDLYAQSREAATSNQPTERSKHDQMTRTPTSTKRVSIAVQPATMRIKSSERIRPSLRRSSSLTLREKKTEPLEDIPEQKVPGTLARSRSTILRPSTLSKATVRSTKAPTVPNFELPGEAVSRRLKEQREARQAQQAEAQKAQAALPKLRSQKPLTRPNFELPGEAISRRKREQHEAKLKAQEEEEKKRREFKARPIRYSIGPSTLPRETITSRARQSKDTVSEHKDSLFEANSLHTPGRASHTLPRGRNSIILPPNTDSRATSASTGSASCQRSSLSSEDAAQQRLRGREIFTRDNSFTLNREKAKREKESAAQLARAEAAERSRALSREWAEKKRRKELSLRRAMRESMQPDAL